MKHGLLIVIILSLPSTVSAAFTGELVLEPEGCEKVRECYTKYPLHYVDSNGVGWEAKAGLKTDGASIPFWAQPFIGKPYEKSYIKAAVVHDHYCDKHVRPWRQTHRVFYDMLRALNVPILKSKVMYYAVLIGGPKWVGLVPGDSCGTLCVNAYNNLKSAQKYLFRPARYAEIKGFDQKLKNMEQLLKEKDLSLDEIDAIAISESPNDFYFKNIDTYPYNPGKGIDN
jgi:hypothetical protein